MLQCQTNNCHIWPTLRSKHQRRRASSFPPAPSPRTSLRKSVVRRTSLGPRVNLLNRAVNHACAHLRPKEPETLDFEVDADFINADVFLVKDIEWDSQRHFVLATDYQLNILRQAKRWFMDGTFKRSGQLFTIYAFLEREGASKRLPQVFVLMSRRTQADYALVFQAVLKPVGNVKVEDFVADFEVGKYHFKWLYYLYITFSRIAEGQASEKYY
ncbi:hypothetical protein DPMN_052073 [Dreissena polymorpha]|uniref:MULE transposase domain-containing protein n=1 Tax=Dreissena polymorpha TaxID=45954 RepID=A0A9D4CL14_DREPO|nr:hypothetical protein DPMN_052073 [Dreissena polymorpha]